MTDQIQITHMGPARPSDTLPGLTAYFSIEVGGLLKIGTCCLLRDGDEWRVRLPRPRRSLDRLVFVPAGREAVLAAAVAAWEAFDAA